MARVPRRDGAERTGDDPDPDPDAGPVEGRGGDGGTRGGGEAVDPYETVLFRHSDANVMAQVVPALGPAQLARLLGPAEALFYMPGPDWRETAARAPVRIVRRQPDWPKAESGLLTIQPDALAAMGGQRATALRAKRARLLQTTAPSLFAGMAEDEVALWVEQHERSGRAIGLRTERGLLQWTYLMGGSKGRFADDPHIRMHLTSGGASPDRRLDAVMGLMVRASQEDRR